MSKQTLVLIRGLPGCGKTTLAKRMVAEGAYPDVVRIEADEWFVRGGAYDFKRGQLPLAHAWCYGCTLDYLALGFSVVVSNTFTQRWEMAQYFEAARLMGIRLEVIEAAGGTGSTHGVPAETIARMAARWEEM